jgi:sulfur carrier protein
MIHVRLEPEAKDIELHRIKTVLGLLNRLELRPTMALVVRDGSLLTPDRRLYNEDRVLVRTVTSAG